MKAILGLLIVLLFSSYPKTALAQRDYDYVRDVWPELLELHHDPVAAPIQWFLHEYTIANVSKERVAAARKQLRMIQAEAMAYPEVEWAGIYTLYATEIGHVIFAFAPKTGYVAFETIGCGGALQNIILGKVEYQRTGVKIIPEYDDPPPPNNNLDDNYVRRAIKFNITYIPVKWGDSYFLVEEKEIAVFCNDFVVGGQDYSKEDAPFVRPLMKLYGRVKDDTVAPILPEKYAHLAKRPIVANVKKTTKITIQRAKETEEDWEQITTFVIDKGSKKGIKKGMEFVTLGRDLKEKEYLKIIRVSRTFALGQHTLFIPPEIRQKPKELSSYLNENVVSLSGKKVRSYSLWYRIEGI